MVGLGEAIFGGGFNMKNYEYVPKAEWSPVRENIIELIHLVQDEVREHFTFSYEFIGSASRNLITREVGGNIGFDFDVNIRVNDDDGEYKEKQIRNILRTAFDKFAKRFGYSYGEDSTRVITLKVKDRANSRIVHGCDFAIVNDYLDNNGRQHQEYIHFNKKQGTYEWQEQPEGYYLLIERVAQIKRHTELWNEVRDVYLDKKCSNENPNKKSRSLFAETIKEVYERHF